MSELRWFSVVSCCRLSARYETGNTFPTKSQSNYLESNAKPSGLFNCRVLLRYSHFALKKNIPLSLQARIWQPKNAVWNLTPSSGAT